MSGRYGSSNWLVSTTVNLTRRSDNGRINSSPKSRSPAIIRWHEGCPSSLRIPVEDPDGDVVKCRFASYSESYKYSDSFPYGTLDEVNVITVSFFRMLSKLNSNTNTGDGELMLFGFRTHASKLKPNFERKADMTPIQRLTRYSFH